MQVERRGILNTVNDAASSFEIAHGMINLSSKNVKYTRNYKLGLGW